MKVLIETARPKINLTLRVLGRRTDGYHELASLVAFADGPSDRITLDGGRPAGVTADGPFAGAIASTNLLQTVLELAAEAAFRNYVGGFVLGHVHLEKNLPVAAGIGGGSADAAALIRLLQRANPVQTETIDWQAIALRIGADVPVCLSNRATWMTGTGERLTALEHLPALSALLVYPQLAVPADKTARVFRALQAGAYDENEPRHDMPPTIPHAQALIDMIDGGNDLEAAATSIVPAISEVLSALRALQGCRVAAMSGAGPTCFAVFNDEAAAKAAAHALQRYRPGWWIYPALLG